MKYHGEEMPTTHPTGCFAMTWEDAEMMENRNQKCGWGFTMANCLHFLANHMEANDAIKDANENPDSTFSEAHIKAAMAEKEKIEWRLEDANFHTFCGLLHDGEYHEALAYIAKDYWDMEVK